jgi:hypothetical protein
MNDFNADDFNADDFIKDMQNKVKGPAGCYCEGKTLKNGKHVQDHCRCCGGGWTNEDGTQSPFCLVEERQRVLAGNVSWDAVQEHYWAIVEYKPLKKILHQRYGTDLEKGNLHDYMEWFVQNVAAHGLDGLTYPDYAKVLELGATCTADQDEETPMLIWRPSRTAGALTNFEILQLERSREEAKRFRL